MLVRVAVLASVVALSTAGCGSAEPQRAAPDLGGDSSSASPDADEVALLSDLSALPFTEEATSYAGPNLPFNEYQQKVNAECRGVLSYVMENPQPSESDGEAVIAEWAIGLLRESSATYRRIADIRPPAEREAEVREGFLTPYFDQLNAFERLYIDVIGGGDKASAEAVVTDATSAKKQLTIYAAKNGLTDCIG